MYRKPSVFMPMKYSSKLLNDMHTFTKEPTFFDDCSKFQKIKKSIHVVADRVSFDNLDEH